MKNMGWQLVCCKAVLPAAAWPCLEALFRCISCSLEVSLAMPVW